MADLDADALRKLPKHLFEKFCRQLLDAEYERHFAAQTVDLEGPAPEDHADGGRDIAADVKAPPNPPLPHWSLLGVGPRKVWFSCKSQADDGKKAGEGWKKLVRDELDPSPRIGVADSLILATKHEQNAVEREAKGKSPNRGLLEFLAEGGEYVFLVNVPAAKQSEFRAEFAAILTFWIQRILQREVDLTGKIHVRDASHLANVYNHTAQFTLSHELTRELSVSEPSFLWSWDHWTNIFSHDRQLMTYESDGKRDSQIAQLVQFVSSEGGPDPAILRWWGPPGVGKTRLVHQALERADCKARVRFSNDSFKVRAWLEDPATTLSRDLVLVVDEVVAQDAYELAQRFETAAQGTLARMIIVGPIDAEQRGKPEPDEIKPLDDAPIRAVLAAQMTTNDARLELVASLCEGYPLYAFWLGKALAADPELLADPGTKLTGDQPPWSATCAVLVGPRGSDANAWSAEGLARAKALLLVVLYPDLGWWRLTDAEHPPIERALVLKWDEIVAATRACEARSLLRVLEGRHRYISPANLERLILNHLFESNPPRLPPDRLRDALPKPFARLVKRAAQVRASDACRDNLAAALWAILEGGVPSASAPLWSLVELGVEQPEFAALRIHEWLAHVGADSVVTNTAILTPIRTLLQHLRHRKLSPEGFAAVEEALFRLARASSESTNAARIAWVELFGPTTSRTHASLERRFELLHARAGADEARDRALAMLGLRQALEDRTWTQVYEPEARDGTWPVPEPHEIAALVERAWSILVECSIEPDEVGEHARAALVDVLRDNLQHQRLGPEQLDLLGQRVESWPTQARVRLNEELGYLTFDAGFELERARSADLQRAFTELDRRVQPRDPFERLIDRVGRRFPVARSIDGGAEPWRARADEVLAHELLDAGVDRARVVEWLRSIASTRAKEFSTVLGHCDHAREFASSMLEGAEPTLAALDLAVAYLVGVAEQREPGQFDRWLDELSPRHPTIVLRARIAVDRTPERMQAILAQLARGEVSPQAIEGLAGRPWIAELELGQLDQLLRAVAGLGPAGRTESIGLAARRVARSTTLGPDLRLLVHAVLADIDANHVAYLDWLWQQACIALAKAGDWEPIRAALVHARSPERDGFPRHLAETLLELGRAGLAESIWSVACEGLDAEGFERLGWVFEDAGLVASVASEQVLRWVGSDVARASALARITQPYAEVLDPLARALIVGFGTESEPARIIANRVSSTPFALTSLSKFFAEQADHARVWAKDPSEVVTTWASGLAEQLADLAERERAREQFERHYGARNG